MSCPIAAQQLRVNPHAARPRFHPPKAPRGRSAVTNGCKLLMSGGATQWGRRFADLVAEHAQDLGGAAVLTEAQIGLIRRVSALECELELREDKLAAGGEVDLDEFARVSGHCRRLWETLGLCRVKRDLTPTIDELVASHKAAAKAAESAKTIAPTPVAPTVHPLTSDPSLLVVAPVSRSEPTKELAS